jgi:hypothetical protein
MRSLHSFSVCKNRISESPVRGAVASWYRMVLALCQAFYINRHSAIDVLEVGDRVLMPEPECDHDEA